jgi:hypothetical protein
MFHKTEGGIKRASDFLSGINVGRVGCAVIVLAVMGLDWIRWVAGVAEIAGSIHINSTVLFLFLIFIFSSFLSPFSSYQICIFHISTFAYFIFAYSHIFKNAAPMINMHSVRKMFHRTERDIKRSNDFLSGISMGRL